MAPPIQVLTIDDQPLFHHGVASMLHPFGDIAVVGAAYSVDEAACLCRSVAPQLALIDIGSLGGGWLAAVRGLLAASSGLRLLILTQAFDAHTVLDALNCGVAGYLLKTVQPMALAQAIRTAATGHLALCAEAMQVVLHHERERVAPVESLTQREREILMYLAKGLSNSEIGERLCITTATVKFHSRNLFGKLNVDSRARAIALAYQHRLVPMLVAAGDPLEHRAGRVAGQRVVAG